MDNPTGRKGKVWICSFLPTSEGRGIERFAMQLRDALNRDGWTTDIVDIQSAGLGASRLGRMRPFAAWKIGRLVNRAAGPDDVIVCNNFFSWNARRRNSVVIYHMTEKGRGIATRHKMGRFRNLAVRTLNSYLDRKTGIGRKVITVSEMVSREVEEFYGLRVDRMIPNAVDLEVFSPGGPKKELRRKLGLPEDEFLVLYVGPRDRKKGLDMIIDGVLPGIRHSQHLVLASDVDLKDSAATVVGRVPFDRMCEYYRACDVLLFPSYYEGWGLTVAEAMASGLPCVVSMTGIGYDLTRDDHLSKYVILGHDPNEYIRRLLSLQEDPKELRGLSTVVRTYAETHYGTNGFDRAYTEFMDEVSGK